MLSPWALLHKRITDKIQTTWLMKQLDQHCIPIRITCSHSFASCSVSTWVFQGMRSVTSNESGYSTFRTILSLPPLQIPFLRDHLKTKPGRQVRSFMAFCYWYHHHHRSLTPDEYLVYYAKGNSRTRKEAKKAITDWLKKDLPRLHKRHHLVRI